MSKSIRLPGRQPLYDICGPKTTGGYWDDDYEWVEAKSYLVQCPDCKKKQEETGQVEYCSRYFVIGYVEEAI